MSCKGNSVHFVKTKGNNNIMYVIIADTASGLRSEEIAGAIVNLGVMHLETYLERIRLSR